MWCISFTRAICDVRPLSYVRNDAMPSRRVGCVTGYRSGVSSRSHSRDSTVVRSRVFRDFSIHTRYEDLTDCDLYKRVKKEFKYAESEKGGLDSDMMEPIYATVRKRNSPPRQQPMFVPQVPLNIQPKSQIECHRLDMDQLTHVHDHNHFQGGVGFQPVHGYDGFRPTPARHFRQNTWGSGYQVMTLFMCV